jgi:PhzF family phenazine biosynthesis protein
MRLPLYQVDAFTDTVFGGNPAAIVPLETWLPDDRMQAIAAENNLAETAFFVPEGDGFGLRWFTPTTEVDLCGHATLATAHVIMTQLQPDCRRVLFSTVTAGDLTVTRDGDLYTLDFPARPAGPATVDPAAIQAALGGPAPRAVLGARDLLVVYDDAAVVRALSPDMVALAKLDYFAVMVTAPGSDTDFVSRFFAPRQGIPEDPVTGSAHCTLVPYWAERLGRSELTAYQASARGGRLWCRMAGDRVMMSGKAVLYLEGTIVV